MAEYTLSQTEADSLLALEKKRVSEDIHMFPSAGTSLQIPLVSISGRESFALDIRKGRIKLTQATFQNRTHSVVVLARLDLDGPPHTNPDGAYFPCPHLHLYREGFGDKWAIVPPTNKFSNLSDIMYSFDEFMSFCNITQKPNIQQGLF